MRAAGLWVLAVVITVGSAIWQRASGPTYPVSGKVSLGGREVALKLARTHGGAGGLPVRVAAPADVSGEVAWRRFPTSEAWTRLPLARRGDALEAELPHLPPAGKLEYQVRLSAGGATALFPARPAVARYKGDVAAAVLVPHVLLMFAAMLLATRAGLAAVAGETSRRLAGLAFACLAVGGFLLGPAVQKMAFGAWWTGFPFGHDLTDNKTLIAGVAWVVALAVLARRPPARLAVALAALVTMGIFAVPHSVRGSEIRWEQVPK